MGCGCQGSGAEPVSRSMLAARQVPQEPNGQRGNVPVGDATKRILGSRGSSPKPETAPAP